jgi:hypothetical protein
MGLRKQLNSLRGSMVLLIINLIGLAAVFLGFFVPFHDATIAVNEGVFSATSVIGYSISRSMFLYVAYLFTVVLGSFVYAIFFKNNNKQVLEIIEMPVVVYKKKEILVVSITALVFALLVLILREKIFNIYSLYSEEFYNLSAIKELSTNSFDIIYPYSIGNLLSLMFLNNFGINFIYYKIFLNSAAFFALYFSLGYLLPSIKRRMGVFFFIILFYFQSILSPSLHRNILRYFLPAFVAVILHYIVYNKKNLKHNFILLCLVCTGVLFFGSADNIVIASVLYLLSFIINVIINKKIGRSLIFLLAPLASMVLMSLMTTFKYFTILSRQFESITFYSGHANSTPYFNLLDIFSGTGLKEIAKDLIYVPAFYLPILLIGFSVAFIVLRFNHYRFAHPQYSLVVLFIAAYAILFRQNFGDAGVGRIAITSAILIFALLILNNFGESEAKITVKAGFVFFVILTVISLYFLRYSIKYYQDNLITAKTHVGLVRCSETVFSDRLTKAGFVWSDTALINELKDIKTEVGDSSVFVYDDTFSLYYLLGKQPAALITTYYMAYSKERLLVNKIKNDLIGIIIFPKKPHFFGVPEQYYDDARFMSVVKEYRDDNFTLKNTFSDFDLFLRK